jgi:hypothetical protein
VNTPARWVMVDEVVPLHALGVSDRDVDLLVALILRGSTVYFLLLAWNRSTDMSTTSDCYNSAVEGFTFAVSSISQPPLRCCLFFFIE